MPCYNTKFTIGPAIKDGPNFSSSISGNILKKQRKIYGATPEEARNSALLLVNKINITGTSRITGAPRETGDPKEAGAIPLGLGLAVADGPLPIGDVIGAAIIIGAAAKILYDYMISKASGQEDACYDQYLQDIEVCKATKSASCYAQAADRLANCLVGRPRPPLNF